MLLLTAGTKSPTLHARLQSPSRFSCAEPLRQPDCRAEAAASPGGQAGRSLRGTDPPPRSLAARLPGTPVGPTEAGLISVLQG